MIYNCVKVKSISKTELFKTHFKGYKLMKPDNADDYAKTKTKFVLDVGHI